MAVLSSFISELWALLELLGIDCEGKVKGPITNINYPINILLRQLSRSLNIRRRSNYINALRRTGMEKQLAHTLAIIIASEDWFLCEYCIRLSYSFTLFQNSGEENHQPAIWISQIPLPCGPNSFFNASPTSKHFLYTSLSTST